MIGTLYRHNSNVIEIPELQAISSGDDIATAVVTLTLTDIRGVEISGQLWPVVMDYVVGSSCCYQATVSHALDLPSRVVAHIIADAGPGLHGEWKTIFNVIERR